MERVEAWRHTSCEFHFEAFFLTDSNKVERLNWALDKVDDGSLTFADMRNFVVLDEKWFNLCEEASTFFLGKDEPEPHLAEKSCRLLPKVMFLCAVARSRFETDVNCAIDSKIAMWPLKTVQAVRASRHRPIGADLLANVNVTKELYTSFLLELVYSAIEEKFPRRTGQMMRLL